MTEFGPTTWTTFRKFLAVVLAAACVACANPPQLTSEVELEANPSGKVPLGALLHFTTDQPARVTLTIDTGDRVETVTPSREFVTEHEVVVLGARPGRTNTIAVGLVGENGEETAAGRVDFVTPPLPDVFPPLELRVSQPARMEPGVTLIPFFRWEGNNPQSVEDWGLFIGVDDQGEVVWTYEVDHDVGEPLRIANGNLIYQSTTGGIMYEIDMLGRVQRTWNTRYAPQGKIPPGSIGISSGDTLHHDVLEMPSGNFLALSTEVRQMEWANSPAPDAEVTERNVIGDVLIEFRPDGEVVREWKLMDLLDLGRRGVHAYATDFYEDAYEPVFEEPTYDWTHTNAVWYLPDEDAALLSVPHQSAILKLDLQSGELDWILGLPDAWRDPWASLRLEPESEVEWFTYQHAVERTPRGTIMIYANNLGFWNAADQPADEDNYTRVLEFEIDEEAGTFRQVWSYGGPEDGDVFLSPFISEADSLPETGNVLLINGGLMTDANGNFTWNFGAAHHWTSVMEVTHDETAEKVWELVIDDPAGGWASYRVERFPSLYPDTR